jgi:nucleoside-diphosphate-sugar epimerase
MHVFLTGATGVIGSRVLPLLVQAGHAVSAVGRTPEKRRALEQAGAHALEMDMFDVESARRAIRGHDAVINLATHIPSSAVKMMFRWSWRENDRVRRVGSATLVDAARAEGVTRLIQESFAPMYVDRGDEWITETTAVSPVSYNRSSLDAERSCEFFAASGGTGVVLRFALLYGPDRLLREMVGVIRKGWSPLPGTPEAYVTNLAQDDAATAVVAALGVPSGTYNVAESDPLRRGDWVSSLADAAGVARPRFMPRWMTRLSGSLRLLSRSQRISSNKFRATSRWSPRYANARAAWPMFLRQLEARARTR